MNATLRSFRDFFCSLKLTVWLLILSMILVFVATLDQVNLGIWAVQAKYFRSFAVLWQLPDSSISIPVFPGGYFIGGLLLINLVAAHIYRFSFTWKKSGIQLAHAGLILLLLGELFTGLISKEGQMRLDVGETKHYAESFSDSELVLIDHSDPKSDLVVSIPEAVLADKKSIQHKDLPFRVDVKEYFPNTNLQRVGPFAGPRPVATQGFGTSVVMLPEKITYRQNERNVPGAYVEIVPPEGSLGIWLASEMFAQPQTFTYGGKTWEIALRLKRSYQPFSLTLLNVTHETYPGTEIPKNFASRVRVRTDDGKQDREVVIFMNNPLRFGGVTFYQYQMNAAQHMSVFQVVRNPSWLLPYIACVMMGAGLCIQFGITLAGFIRKRSAATASATNAAERA